MGVDRFRAGMTALAISVGMLIVVSSAKAGTKDGQFAVEAPGRAKCSSYLKARADKSANLQRYMGFIEGYITAANRYEPNTFDLTPWHNAESYALILDLHCKKNPQDTLVLSAERLVASFQPIRLAEFSKVIEVGDKAHHAILYETILKRAQKALAQKGLYKGEADGRYNDQLKAAVQQFQTSAKLEPTGVPDAATLWVLLNP